MKTFTLAFMAGLVWMGFILWDIFTGDRVNRAIMGFFKGSDLGGWIMLACLLLIAFASLRWFVGLFRSPRRSCRRGNLKPDGSTF